MTFKRRLLFILPNLESGGAERVILTLLKNLDRLKYELHLAVVNNQGKFSNEVPEDVIFHDLKAIRVRMALPALLRLIRQVRPEILFSTLGHLNLGLILLKPFLPKGTRLLIRESSLVSENLRGLPYSLLWKGLYWMLYYRADRIICLCEAMAADLRNNFGIPPHKMVCIYNPVDIGNIQSLAARGENPFKLQGPGPNLVSVGRLSLEKGIGRLLQAFPLLLVKEPKARLWILGQGGLQEELKRQIHQMGLDEKITLSGFQSNPFVWMKYADLFVLPSRFEGLPNTLLEALACGCPVVALHHPGGTGEVLRTLGLEQRYVSSLEDWPDTWWQRPGPKVEEAFKNHFSLRKIVGEYEALLSGQGLKKA